MINITINKQKLRVEEEMTVLEAAQEAGIKIPTLCHHKALSPYGACRVCLVEIVSGGKPGRVAACHYPARDGLVVETDTEKVRKTRKVVLELLLACSPDSKPLKALAGEYGITQNRLEKEDKDDCILCGLCVRVCRERMGQSVIGFSGRGYDRGVLTPFDKKSPICMGCGACAFVCPTGVIKPEDYCEKDIIPLESEFDWGVGNRPVVNVMYPQAVPNIPVIDKEHCVYFNKELCKVCETVCGPEAIDYEQKDEILKIKVGSVVIGAGLDRFDPKLKPEYNYTNSKNVISSPEFERILSASGPFEGHLVRPSDHKKPDRIAFLQCVGSRDETCNPYCSSVCCMYATKEAIVAKEHAGQDLETDIYYMDIRAYGKGFDQYIERAKSQYKVNFIRCRLAGVAVMEDESEDLVVKYVNDEGKVKEEKYGLIILSTGLVPHQNGEFFNQTLGLDLNEFHFVQTDGFHRESTSRNGIFACGAIVEPKDIPETVIQASAAASCASGLLAESRGTMVKEKTYPKEKNVTEEHPRIGVFVCHCGINIGGTVNVPEVAEYAKTLADVVYVEQNLYTCSQDTQVTITNVIEEYKLNRVVIASCTPRTHEALFQDTIREAGLNPFLLEFVSLREHCSWVHMLEKEKATEKSKELVTAAISKARHLEALHRTSSSVIKKGLVIGGGISGMTAALSLAEQGFEVFLLEKEKQMGGNLRHLYFTLAGDDPQALLTETIEKVKNHKKIQVFKESRIKAFSGYVGNYKTQIVMNGQHKEKTFEHGIVIVATGAKERDIDAYLHKKNEKVITQTELEKRLSQEESARGIREMRCVVMIQCVGSRDDEVPYCSRMCCSKAIKNALKLKKINPKLNVYVLYRDIRTYGFQEMFYEQARDKGIMFIRFEKESKPRVKKMGDQKSDILVELKDPILQEVVKLSPDLLVLSTGVAPHEDSKELAQMLKVPLNEDGFFLEAHVKLRPVDFSVDGIFLCGLAHSPKTVDEAISQGRAAAGRAVTLLAKDTLSASGRTVWAIEKLCSGCGLCIDVCPYQSRELDRKTGKAKVTEVLCQGCGACVVACPNGATQQFGFTRKELIEAVDAM